MDYFENQSLLRSVHHYSPGEITIPDSRVRLFNCEFRSEEGNGSVADIRKTGLPGASSDPGLLARTFTGNYSFTYPVFVPEGQGASRGAIILLHGLNERNWSKYLYWGRYLAETTGKTVMLFPMAFHINRSPGQWSDPRLMQEIVKTRTSDIPRIESATVVNAALSTRLDYHPEWFCESGLQSCYDLIALTRMIRNGSHPRMSAGASVDFFAYSIGAFLLEVLLIANAEDLFAESRNFLFLGGSSFEQMHGISRYIMDSRAFGRLEETYIRQDPKTIREAIRGDARETFNRLWSAFMAMLRLDRLQVLRERSFDRLRNQISAVSLARDRIIPPDSIIRTIRGAGNNRKIPVSVLDFPYPYSHENPFPAGNDSIRTLVDQAFHKVFDPAARFLA
jgi:hypothetical protein